MTDKGKGAKKRNNDGGKNTAGKKRGRSRSRGRSKKVDPVKYWGDVSTLPPDDDYVVSSPDPSTVVNSLGRPPIPGHENASKHYFSLVYDRASALAVALAAAGGLGEYGSSDPEGPPEADDDPDAGRRDA